MNTKKYHKALLYQSRWMLPTVRWLLRCAAAVTYLASLTLLASLVYKLGFEMSEREVGWLAKVHGAVWVVFLVDIALHLLLDYRDTKRAFRSVTWVLSVLLYLTLLPVVFFEPEEGPIRYVWQFFHSPTYRLVILSLLSLLNLSNGVVRLLGRRTNPSLILACSFFVLIALGTGLLMLPRCTYHGIGWIDALFTATSATCVTGLVTVDVPSTFTPQGQWIIALLMQIGGLGVMTLTSFFALFFMGNTSVYNQLAVRDMVSSDSLDSLLSTLLYILGFTLLIELAGTALLLLGVHGDLGMGWEEELAFAAFHSVSAFCNAGFSTLPGGLGNETLMHGHNFFYWTISWLIVLGGIGFPILVNLRRMVAYELRRILKIVFRRRRERRQVHLFNLNTKIVLMFSALLLFGGTALFAWFEWDGALAGLSAGERLTQAFFNAACPRTAGFSSVPLTSFGIQSLLLMLMLMMVGGGSQSTAGGIKVNAFAVVVLNLWAVLRGKDRVEIFGRELPYDSVRRSDATILVYLIAAFAGIFVLSWLEPEHSLLALTFECVSALSTVGSSLDVTPTLGTASKCVVSFLMFVGRVGMITLLMGIVRQQRITNYRYPTDNIIIN